MALTIGELVGYLDLKDDGWGRKNKQAHDDMRSMRDDLDSVSEKSNKLAADFLKLANNLSNVPTAMQAISGTATFLGQMSGALGLIPAAGAGAILAIVTLKTGLSGFGDALKDSGDPKKFAEDLKGLAPAARDSATAVRDLHGAWDQMHKTVQQSLFAGLAEDIKKLGGSYIPVLRVGMSGIANEFNNAAHQTASFLEKGAQVTTVTQIFGNTRQSVGDLTSTLQPLISILLDVVAVGSDMLPGLTHGFGSAAQGAADFVHQARESGKLREWIQTGLNAIGQLVQLFKNLASIAGSVFTGLHAGGAGLMTTLLKVTGMVADFLKSFEGQQALHALGDALNTVSAVVTQVLLTALHILAPLIVQLAPPFAELARQVGSVLVTALHMAGPLLQMLAGFLAANIDWLGPLAIAIFAGVKAFEAISGAIKIVNMLAATNPWLILIAATIALAILIITHWDEIKAALAAAWDWIKNTARTVWEHIKSAIIDPIADAAKWLWDTITGIVQWFIDLPGKIWEGLKNLFDILTKPFRDAWNFISDIVSDIMSAVNQITGKASGIITGGRVIVSGGSAGSGLFRAAGGPVMAGQRYIVGEKGPEEFVPKQNGDIIPNGYTSDQRALVSVGVMNVAPEQSPHDIAFELDWLSKGGGR